MASFSPQSYLFAPSDTHGFLLLKCGPKPFKQGDDKVECLDAITGERVVLSAAQTKLCEATDASSLKTIEDMVKLPDLKEASILHNLRERFTRDDIYTSIGSILVAVNPFKIVNLYSPDILEAYAAAAGGAEEDSNDGLPPHIFRIADAAYRNVVSLQENQACLVSGESGAGKTEATKILLQFLTEMSARTASEDWGEQGRLQEQILKANPLMEAFGNAKTVRNNNSSRFGKYIEVKFNSHLGTITGGSVTQYLLEKSRIVFQSPRERNYHIFYQLVEAAKMDEDFRKRYRIAPHQAEHGYLFHANASEGINDERGWGETCQAMETLSMSPEEIDNLVRTICGVLHLGNLVFSERKVANVEQASQVSNQPMLDLVAYQLGLDSAKLARALCEREVRTPNHPSVFTPYTIAQAMDVRDSLAKAVYGMAFDWLIKRINWALDAAAKNAVQGQKMTHNVMDSSNAAAAAATASNEASIGVLDIFGFECFEHNSFEQLCINYCNERLQGFFTEHIFKLEQQEYVKEGLGLETITFKDNAEIIDLLERRRTGLFALIDEEGSVPRGSDEALTNKAVKTFAGHAHFRQKNPKDHHSHQFGIVHFAGEVQYTVDGFLAKNKDAVPNDVLELLQESQHRFIRALFPPTPPAPAVSGKANQSTVGGAGGKRTLISQFKLQLDTLMDTLSETQPHFIRCVKPNKFQRGAEFDGSMVLEQLRYAGLLEVCRIRKQGFPVRRDHAYFVWRFGVILGKGAEAAQGRQNVRALAELLVKHSHLRATDYVLGTSKLFLKSEALDKLERLRGLAVETSATTVQTMIRGKLARLGYAKQRELLTSLHAATASRDVAEVERLLLGSALLPNQGRHLAQVKLARKMMQQVEEERRVERLVADALLANEMDTLMTALQAARDLKYQSPTVLSAQSALDVLKREASALASLQQAMQARDLAAVRAALAVVETLPGKAAAKKNSTPLLSQARALIVRLQEEEMYVSKMRAAIKAGEVGAIKQLIDEMVSYGMGKHALVSEALQITKEQSAAIEKFQRIVDALRQEAVDAGREVKCLQALQQRVLELGVSRGVSKEIDQALDLLAELDRANAQRRALQNARNALGVKATRTAGLSSAEDLDDLRQALHHSQLPREDDEVKETVDCLERAERQLKVQALLQQVLANPAAQRDLAELKSALEQCKGLEMNTVDVYIKLRERILQLEEASAKAAMAAAASANASAATPQQSKQRTNTDLEMDEDALERKNKEKLRNARSPGYYFGNYFRLRSDADFAKGIMFNKNKPITAKLSHQSDPIHKSLCELAPELSRSATRLNRNILGYCGDVMMSFPASLAQDLVDKCLANPALVDEVYLQLCKHATLNPEPQSLGRAWQLICICVGSFPPTSDFEPYLLNFLLKSYAKGSIIGQYARYALRRLQSTISFGPSAETLSIDEIVAYGDRPPVMATIQLTDGTNITKDFPVPPHMNVDDVLRICAEFLGLSEERAEWFGMFVKETPLTTQRSNNNAGGGKENVDAFFTPQAQQQVMSMPDGLDADMPPPPPPMDEDEDDIPPRTAYPLENTQYLGEVVLSMVRTQMTETLVYKRKFFLPRTLMDLGTDAVYNRLMYLQILDEVLGGSWHVNRLEEVIDLAAIAFAVDLGEDMPSDAQGMLDEGLMEYLPLAWKPKKTEMEWAKLVLAKRAMLLESDAEELELLYMQTCQEVLPTFGACTFYVRRDWGGSDYIAFVDYNGFRVMTLQTRECVLDVRYKQMRKITGTSRVLTLDLVNGGSEKVFTSQAKEIAGLMQEYRNLLSLVPEDDLEPASAAMPPKRKFFNPTATATQGGGKTGRSNNNNGQDLLNGIRPMSSRDRISSVSFMKPSATNATLEAARKKVF